MMYNMNRIMIIVIIVINVNTRIIINQHHRHHVVMSSASSSFQCHDLSNASILVIIITIMVIKHNHLAVICTVSA